MTSVSKNVYIDKVDDIEDKYKDTYHSTTNMKPVDLNETHILTLVKKLKIKILNLKLLILTEYQNIKILLQKATLQTGLKKFLSLKTLKTLWRGHMLLMILKEKKLYVVIIVINLMLTTCKNLLWKTYIKIAIPTFDMLVKVSI